VQSESQANKIATYKQQRKINTNENSKDRALKTSKISQNSINFFRLNFIPNLQLCSIIDLHGCQAENDANNSKMTNMLKL